MTCMLKHMMHHQGTKILTTRRLLLRPFTADDGRAIYENWASDADVTTFLRWPAHADMAVTKEVLKSWIDGYMRPDFYQWAIVPTELGEPIGTISVMGMNEQADSVHVGYCIGQRWWRQGFVSEAFSAVIDFLFRQVGANRIESQHDPDNPGSGAVMRHCGLQFEGRLRKGDWSNRWIVDADLYSILRDEYEQQPHQDPGAVVG